MREHKTAATIPIRLPHATAAALRERAREHKVTTSELIRALLADAMAAWGITEEQSEATN